MRTRRIAIPPETRFVMPTYDRRRELRRPERSRRTGASSPSTSCRAKGTAFKDLGLDPDATIEEIVAGPPTLGSALGIVFRAYAQQARQGLAGATSGRAYLLNLRHDPDLFPDAQIVHIIRDGRDCVASLKEAPWHKGGVFQAVATGAAAWTRAPRAARRLGPDSYFEIYYERLVANPEAELREALRLPRRAVRPGDDRAQRRRGRRGAVAQDLARADPRQVTDRARRGWAQRLDPGEIGLCEAVMGDRLRAYGYTVSGSHKAGADNLARYARYAARSRLSRIRRRATVAYHRVSPLKQVAAQLTAAEVTLARESER